MNAVRIAVFAYSDVGYACLKYLLDRKENVVAVFTHRDKPGETLWFPSVAEIARVHGIPVITEENLHDPAEQKNVADLKLDLLFSFYYRNLIPESIFSLPRLGAFNMHGSYLPYYRGRAPVNWAIINGETETGATLHVMTSKADAGDIVDQEKVAIGADETALIVQKKVTAAAVRILERRLSDLKNGTAPRHPQDISQGRYYGRRKPEDGLIDWTWPARRVHNLVRALTHPFPGAFGDVLGMRCFIWSTALAPKATLSDPNRLIVRCGDGIPLEVMQIQKEGGPEMSGSEFLNSWNRIKKEKV